MKAFTALGAGIVIAAVAAAWFTTRPVLVHTKVRPLEASANIPTFKPVPSNLARE
ncbi:hypothetical protein [Bradyrhizobium sp. Rc2d]|uniref:hypothetical protein n=1 Tax=Bradyrhizobium sp. Rc2d TaxID=1855321 RepID=UPI0015A44FC2|nr:hypothetical protein [Bradyrhizobium sp. Rc2d]